MRAHRVGILTVLGVAVALLVVVVGVPVALMFWRSGDLEVADAKSVDLPRVGHRVQRELPAIPWTDITASAGIRFVHNNGAAGDVHLGGGHGRGTVGGEKCGGVADIFQAGSTVEEGLGCLGIVFRRGGGVGRTG
jgi:hypothetical protein